MVVMFIATIEAKLEQPQGTQESGQRILGKSKGALQRQGPCVVFTTVMSVRRVPQVHRGRPKVSSQPPTVVPTLELVTPAGHLADHCLRGWGSAAGQTHRLDVRRHDRAAVAFALLQAQQSYPEREGLDGDIGPQPSPSFLPIPVGPPHPSRAGK